MKKIVGYQQFNREPSKEDAKEVPKAAPLLSKRNGELVQISRCLRHINWKRKQTERERRKRDCERERERGDIDIRNRDGKAESEREKREKQRKRDAKCILFY